MAVDSPADSPTSTEKPAAVTPSQAAVAHGVLSPSSTATPFSGIVKKLHFNEDLEFVAIETGRDGEKQTRRILTAKEGKKQYLPGQPRIRLDKPAHNLDGNKDQLLAYFNESHNTEKLDELLPLMRYIFVQTPSYEHIMPLHHQGSHAREIKVTENPGLHLVWYYEMIFIKPIPAYFYSQAFWDYLENANETLYKACLGFMRSYYMLIKYEIDFEDACKLRLIPKKSNGERPTYEEWCEFIVPFSRVGDLHVNRRYHYGELRLTRINRTAMFFKFSLAYFHIYPQWGSFLEHTLAPIITIFAVCSVVLNSMQVGLAAIVMLPTLPDGQWPIFVDASIWFPVVVMVSIAAVLVAALLGMGVMGLKDLVRGNYVRQQKKRGEVNAGTRTHGMVW